MHAFGGLGLWLTAPGVLILLWLLLQKLLGEDIGGRPLLLVGVMLLLMGAQLIAAGLIGELLIRVYHEAGGIALDHLSGQHARHIKRPLRTAGDTMAQMAQPFDGIGHAASSSSVPMKPPLCRFQ